VQQLTEQDLWILIRRLEQLIAKLQARLEELEQKQ
jgi:hypothetical protein